MLIRALGSTSRPYYMRFSYTFSVKVGEWGWIIGDWTHTHYSNHNLSTTFGQIVFIAPERDRRGTVTTTGYRTPVYPPPNRHAVPSLYHGSLINFQWPSRPPPPTGCSCRQLPRTTTWTRVSTQQRRNRNLVGETPAQSFRLNPFPRPDARFAPENSARVHFNVRCWTTATTVTNTKATQHSWQIWGIPIRVGIFTQQEGSNGEASDRYSRRC